MPTVTAAVIISRAAVALQDTAGVRWTRTELLDYLNEGQRELVIKKPSAYVLHINMLLAAGTRQFLPGSDDSGQIDPIQLIEIVRNSTGRAVRLIERALLDAVNQDWHAAPQATLVQHYCFNELDPASFFVYPPNNGSGCVEITCSAAPPALPSESAVIALDDIYQGALLDYCVYRAFLKDAEYAADPARAAARYASFLATLEGKATQESVASPTRIAQARTARP